ncbi:MAG: VCBS repeat-containing protein [Myxococcota bacterium]
MKWAWLGVWIVACGGGGGGGGAECRTSGDCPAGSTCVDEACVARGDGGVDAAREDSGGEDAGACETIVCEGACCQEGERCASFGCVIDLGPCTSNDDCAGDSYCDTDRCTPYGQPPDVTNDPDCERDIEIGAFEPNEQCRWSGDAPLADWANVYSAPMVVDFNLDDDDAVLSPSIVFTSFNSARNGGVLRVVDGRTCETQFTLDDPADRLIYASNNAIGDLDGDGSRPEIVGNALVASETPGGIVAFGFEGGALVRRWYGRRCDMPGEPRFIVNDWTDNNGPSLYDLDDDGIPEVLHGRHVYDANGCVLNPSQPYESYLRLGIFSVVSDVDGDGAVELVYPDGVYQWTGSDWALEDYWAPTDVANAARFGHVAIADFGDFGDGEPGEVEIAVASAPSLTSNNMATGNVRIMTLSGRIVFGPYDLPAEPGQVAGRGGPPTVGDFDGDGRRELAVAGGSRYTVFDIDCDIDGATGAGCERAEGLPRGVLWSRLSQDRSSNVTGSSVFDFDADGVAEVVYGDECFLRIYRGTDGEVLFSQSASSGTGYEYPVIADVDGDFNSEIVVAMTSGVSCPATDPIFSGDSSFASSQGIVVLRDAMDRWAASRPIWNQHAYHINHVETDGTIPRTSAWTPNDRDMALNNFRMNAQGTLERTGAADLTVALSDDVCGAMGETELVANVCNRGTNPVPDGARVVFYEGDPDEGASIACETMLPRLLEVGMCTAVSCTYTIPEEDAPDIVVVVDPDGEVFECRNGNNRGVIPAVFCGLI